MANMNDYVGLMQLLQQPDIQKQQQRNDALLKLAQVGYTVLQQVQQNKTQQDIKGMVKDAETSGKKVSYSIDPNTGAMSPTISSGNNYEGIFEALKNPDVAAKYELGRGSKGEPRLIQKKQIKNNLIEGMKSIIDNIGKPDPVTNLVKTTTTIKNPVTGQDETIDIANEEDVAKALGYHGIEDWRNNPELIESGIPALYDKKMDEWKASQEQQKTESEPRVQPMDKGLKSIGAGAKYKEAIAKYGESKAAKIVDVVVNLQKQGLSLSKIEALMKEQGIDPDIVLKAYRKK